MQIEKEGPDRKQSMKLTPISDIVAVVQQIDDPVENNVAGAYC